MRYFIRVQYDGSQFFGFQRQSSKKTVQKEIENALSIINKSPVMLKGAGRTDVGVHANGQGIHFDLDFAIPSERLITAINSIVHPFIHVLECKEVGESFHARFSVKEKKYIYKIWVGAFSPFKENYYLQYGKKIDLKKLEECAKVFIGNYDFHNFVSGSRDNSNACISAITIKKMEEEIVIIFTGKSFYRYMVRNLVGAMLDVNEGKCDILLLERMLKESGFSYQLSTAPAKGLYLEEVYYE